MGSGDHCHGYFGYRIGDCVKQVVLFHKKGGFLNALEQPCSAQTRQRCPLHSKRLSDFLLSCLLYSRFASLG